MPKINSRLTGTAGEHYVAYKLSLMNIVAAIPREGAPTVDILACNLDATRTISIQVKTTDWAQRTRGRGDKKKLNHLEFPLGYKAATHYAKDLYFAFVDLRGIEWVEEQPDVYIVPSKVVFDHLSSRLEGNKMVRFHPHATMMEKYKNNWDIVRKALG